MLTQELVKELFDYKDGKLYWKVPLNWRISAGSPAGSLNKATGYLYTQIAGKKYLNARIIFLLHHGYLPQCVDHIDRNPLNNQLTNLRAASKGENNQNTKLRVDSTTKIKGVTWDKQNANWRVSVWINGKQKTIGRYSDIELAELVAVEARNKYHKEFASHG